MIDKATWQESIELASQQTILELQADFSSGELSLRDYHRKLCELFEMESLLLRKLKDCNSELEGHWVLHLMSLMRRQKDPNSS